MEYEMKLIPIRQREIFSNIILLLDVIIYLIRTPPANYLFIATDCGWLWSSSGGWRFIVVRPSSTNKREAVGGERQCWRRLVPFAWTSQLDGRRAALQRTNTRGTDIQDLRLSINRQWKLNWSYRPRLLWISIFLSTPCLSFASKSSCSSADRNRRTT